MDKKTADKIIDAYIKRDRQIKQEAIWIMPPALLKRIKRLIKTESKNGA